MNLLVDTHLLLWAAGEPQKLSRTARHVLEDANRVEEEKHMGSHRMGVRALLLAGTVLSAAPAFAAEVTPDRLVNADREPGNWLMNHRTYDAQRYSPLARINKDNVKGLKLIYTVALGGTAANEFLQAT